MSDQTQSYEIERLGHLGDGITADGLKAPQALPGETVTGDLVDDRLDNIKIVTPSSDRIKAPCPVYSRCGGCSLQHYADNRVTDFKIAVVKKSLSARGIKCPNISAHTSPAFSRRRAVFSGRRTKKGVLVGFHQRRSDNLVEVRACHLLAPGFEPVFPAMAELCSIGASRKSEVSFAVTLTENGLDVDVSNALEADFAALAEVAERHDLARLSWNEETIVTRRSPEILFDGIVVVPPPRAFLQATIEGEQALQNSVTQALATSTRIVDFFSGCGTFALPLARFAQVDAYEDSVEMTDALQLAARGNPDLMALRGFRRDLFRQPLLSEDLAIYDGAVIDPPRSGAFAQAKQIAASSMQNVAFVSCNPVTFARDAELLVAGGFDLVNLKVVDQFRWSVHVELVAHFKR
jgi:23S rRNA (uracil1939-C5)-methyltransferase